MIFDLVVDGNVNKVELSQGKVITVEVDGETFQAEVKKTGKGMTVYLDKKEFKVQFKGPQIYINGHKHKIEVCNLRRGKPSWSYSTELREADEIGKTAHKVSDGEGMIFPPMPGRIISVKVKEGELVKRGSPVLVLEAMKMQNEIVSNTDGIVQEIRVSEGELVESGDVLVVISR
jgi:biotin carboxyl carrier protein